MPNPANAPKVAKELELKFIVPAAQVASLQKRPPLPGTRKRKRVSGHRQKLLSVYYDTPDLELRRRGISLRVRHVDGRRLQTVKCEGTAATGRLECEHEINGDGPDLTCVKETGLRKLFSEIGAPNRLRPVFATEIDRTAWEFRHRDAAIECALDVGEIRADGKAIPVHELELELKDGAVAGLFAAAKALERRVPLLIEWESKGQRGYALAAGRAPEPPPPAKLKPKTATRAALAAIASACFGQIRSYAPLVRRRGEIEDVHQMRVAVRRLRAVLSTFRRAWGESQLEFEKDLRWLQDSLGAVRDWDVFREDIVEPVDEHRDVVLVEQATAKSRRDAYERLCAALDSPRCTSLCLSITHWLTTLADDYVADTKLDKPVRQYAKKELHRRARKLDKRGNRIEKLDEAELHKLRIGVKKLRYAAELFHDLLPKKRLKKALRAMKGLQDLLGNLNDARAANRLLGRLEPTYGGTFARAFDRGEGVIEGSLMLRTREERDHLARQWRKYEATEKPWD